MRNCFHISFEFPCNTLDRRILPPLEAWQRQAFCGEIVIGSRFNLCFCWMFFGDSIRFSDFGREIVVLKTTALPFKHNLCIYISRRTIQIILKHHDCTLQTPMKCCGVERHPGEPFKGDVSYWKNRLSISMPRLHGKETNWFWNFNSKSTNFRLITFASASNSSKALSGAVITGTSNLNDFKGGEEKSHVGWEKHLQIFWILRVFNRADLLVTICIYIYMYIVLRLDPKFYSESCSELKFYFWFASGFEGHALYSIDYH